MMLEILTEAENWKLHYTDQNIEDWATDFDMEIDLFHEIIDFMLLKQLLFLEDGMLFSKRHIERFQNLSERREKNAERAKTQERNE